MPGCSFFVILNELLGRGRIPAACVRIGLGQLSWFVILNELFGRGRIPAIWVKVWVVKILLPFKHDSSNEYAGFFTAFRMTCRVVFCHSERAFGRGRIPTLRRLVEVFKLLISFKHDSSNEYAGFFTAFRMTCRVVFCNSDRFFQSQNRSILSMPLFFCGITSLLPNR